MAHRRVGPGAGIVTSGIMNWLGDWFSRRAAADEAEKQRQFMAQQQDEARSWQSRQAEQKNEYRDDLLRRRMMHDKEQGLRAEDLANKQAEQRMFEKIGMPLYEAGFGEEGTGIMQGAQKGLYVDRRTQEEQERKLGGLPSGKVVAPPGTFRGESAPGLPGIAKTLGGVFGDVGKGVGRNVSDWWSGAQQEPAKTPAEYGAERTAQEDEGPSGWTLKGSGLPMSRERQMEEVQRSADLLTKGESKIDVINKQMEREKMNESGRNFRALLGNSMAMKQLAFKAGMSVQKMEHDLMMLHLKSQTNPDVAIGLAEVIPPPGMDMTNEQAAKLQALSARFLGGMSGGVGGGGGKRPPTQREKDIQILKSRGVTPEKMDAALMNLEEQRQKKGM